ncbi:MAG: hypothetical protein ACK40G_18405 [Cytophagaceae bacterium]
MKRTFLYGLLLVIGLFSFYGKPGQIFQTSLRVTVLNELGNTVQDAKVTLYKTEEDYKAEKNAVESKNTDAKGVLFFDGLEPKEYYIYAEKGDRNNAGGGEKTEVLKKDRVNKINVVITE